MQDLKFEIIELIVGKEDNVGITYIDLNNLLD